MITWLSCLRFLSHRFLAVAAIIVMGTALGLPAHAGLGLPRECSIGQKLVLSRSDLSISAQELVNQASMAKAEITAVTDADSAELLQTGGSAITKLRRALCLAEFSEAAGVRARVETLVDGGLVKGLIKIGDTLSDQESSARMQAKLAYEIARAFAPKLSDVKAQEETRQGATVGLLRLAVGDGDGTAAAREFEELIVQAVESAGGDVDDPYPILQNLKGLITDVDLVAAAADLNPLGIQRALFGLVAQFPEAPANAGRCDGASNSEPSTRALLVGIGTYSDPSMSLPGPANDVALLKKALEVRGIENIQLAINLNRKELIARMRDLVMEVRCGDSVLFHFSGLGGTTDGGWQRLFGLKGWTSGIATVDATTKKPILIFGAEISQFVTAVRNHGANIFVVLDTDAAAGLAIRYFQRLASTPFKEWSGKLTPRELVETDVEQLGSIMPLSRHAGRFAVLYASDVKGHAGEKILPFPDGTQKQAGLFSYAIAKVLQTQERPTVRELAQAIAKEYESYASIPWVTLPVFEASSPDLHFLEIRRPLQKGTLDIEILSPNAVDGLLIVRAAKFRIIGRVTRPEAIANLTVNHHPVRVNRNGQFAIEVDFEPGPNKVVFAATDYDYVFHTKTFEFDYVGDLERIAVEGSKYALVIGNQVYQRDDVFPNLETPHQDAKAVAQILTEQYGFRTRIQNRNGKSEDLLLLDATQRQIQAKLRVLRNRLTHNDTLLIYFAGHGKYYKDIDRAYWIPADGEPDAEYTWIKATDLTDNFKRFTARNILVVADSCYSGAMATRDVPELRSLDEDRRKALFKAANTKSRILISSGGVEPVLDAGGGDHSVFASAFLRGLQEMDQDVFSTQEIYSQFIYPLVHGNEKQEPRHKELAESGHEGGDVIFVKLKPGNPSSAPKTKSAAE